MLAAMSAHDQPLCLWLQRYFDRLGIPNDEITKGRLYPNATLYPARDAGEEYLATTKSFRDAFAMATELRDNVSRRRPVGVRHFIAAYAVTPNYHLRDFRRYRIDRREWCLTLALELSERFPDEGEGWADYSLMAPPLLPLALDNDTPDGPDYRHLSREVETFARMITARSTSTPLAIGVFGSWGSGKSFFMHRTREQVAELSRKAAAEGVHSAHHAQIAQVEFNAWHYSEASLIASLVDHLFRNLRRGEDEDDATVRRRGAELMALLDEARHGVASAETDISAATKRLQEAEERAMRARAALPEAVEEAYRALVAAQQEESQVTAELERALGERDVEIARARTTAGLTAWFKAIPDETTSHAFGDAAAALISVADQARTTRARWRPIGIGAALSVLTVLFVLLAGTRVWAQVLAAVTAVTAAATMAARWLTYLNDLSHRGEQLLADKEQATTVVTERVTAKYATEIATLEAAHQSTQDSARAALERFRATTPEPTEIEFVRRRRDEVVEAVEQRELAQTEVGAIRAELEKNSIDAVLREFLSERSATDVYRRQLGILSQVRNDFDRLSKLIAKATADYYDRGKPPPAVSRIVLYIDDLDRCPEGKVIEVLRAVHLLLAFDLFVCVVAVDPRWLTSCLSRAPGVIDVVPTLNTQFGKPADAADYIEKIFQVPIWLRPVSQDLRPAVVRSWLDNAHVNDATEQPPITKAELDFLDKLAPFLPDKPRTLKRFANTYRLVKTRLSDVEFRTFTDEGQPGDHCPPFRICMTLLAVLSADRDQSIRMIENLDAEQDATTMGTWLDNFKVTDETIATFIRATVNDEDLQLTEFRTWLERTRRYSFYL